MTVAGTGTGTGRFGARLSGVLATLLLGLTMLLATPALAADGVSTQDFEGYPGIPVYRLWDPDTGQFMFTSSDDECTSLQYDDDWVYDGIAFFTASSGEPVYRVADPSSADGDTLWTDDYNEYLALLQQGWEGSLAWYSSGDIPVHLLHASDANRHVFTTSQVVLGLLGADAPWDDEGIAFSAVAPGTDVTPKVVGPLDPSASSASLKVGQGTTVTVENVTPGTLSACSDDEAVAMATVDGTDVVIDAKGAGTTTVSIQRSAKGFYPAAIEKVSVTVAAADQPNVNVWRLYNPYTHEHLFTAQQTEYEQLPALGWQQEGMAWVAPATSSTPVYRLYNPYSFDHHYTASYAEYQGLMAAGWNGEGEYWYSDDAQRVPVYRLFNPYQLGAGAHQFTTDTVERQSLLGAGWNDEQIGWYGIEKGQPITPPASNPPTPSNPGGGQSGSGGETGGGGGTTQPSNPNAEPFYWINTKTHVIHGDSCRSLANANLSASHWRKVMTPEEAASYLAQGYTKCKNCKPTGI